jgi:poly(3-hydroxybutyrate) depolymerase
VISLHGRNGSARWQALLTKWHEVAKTSGFIVIYPQGPNSTWNTDAATDNPDVAFLNSVIADTKANFAIDPERIFFNGVSMGSAMGNRVVGQDPTPFAAAALCYSGHLSASRYTTSELRRDVPIPIWQCRGGTELPSDFPGGTAGEAAARLFWRETVNKNLGPPVVQVDGKKTTEIWSNGLAEYRWQVTADVPHFWPAGQAEKIWKEMFSKYRRLADGSLIKTL